MLRHVMIFLVFLTFSEGKSAESLPSDFKGCASQTHSCDISSLDHNLMRDIQSLQKSSLQQIDKLLNDKDLQDFVTEIKDKGTKFTNFPDPSNLLNPDSRHLSPVTCYVFVSLSMGEKALLHLAKEAKRWGAVLVLRGFLDGSYKKTVHSLQKIVDKTGQGILIDPELFSLFGIESVPAIVLSKPVPIFVMDRAQTPVHDRLQGHVSLRYALETFAKEGDLKQEAQALLKRGVVE